MKLFIFYVHFLFLCYPFTIHGFSHDRAIYTAQRGNIASAQEQFQKIIVNCPDDADALYDAGIIAKQMNKVPQAIALFERAAECAQNKDLAFSAHFNAGTLYSETKELEKALKEFEKCLVIQPDNKYAQHNRDRIAQLLQEKDKQENKDKNQENNKDDKNNEKDEKEEQRDKNNSPSKDPSREQENDSKDEKENRKSNDSQSDESALNNSHDQKRSDQKKEPDKSKDNQNDSLLDQQNSSQRDNAKENHERTQRKEHGDQQKEEQYAEQNQQGNGKNNLEQKPENTKSKNNTEQSDQHNVSPVQQGETIDNANQTSVNMQEQKLDQWLLSILDSQEKQDQIINKKLMELKVRQHSGNGNNGQNCW